MRMLPMEILRAKQDGAPPARIEMLQQYMEECIDQINAMEKPPQMDVQPGAPMPPGMPGMPGMGGPMGGMPPAMPGVPGMPPVGVM